MSTIVRLSPSEYRGQELCPRCGNDGTGHGYAICADKADFSHEESCALYTYGDLCAECAIVVPLEVKADNESYEKGRKDGLFEARAIIDDTLVAHLLTDPSSEDLAADARARLIMGRIDARHQTNTQ